MATFNVNRKVNDQFYRYKMPKLLAKVEGKGNGIKTVIVNMEDVSKSIYRPAAYPTKYFGCELGAQTQIDKKNDRYIVNGSHTGDKLQDLLDGFIEKFVLCFECENPETNLVVKKDRILAVCAACGHHGDIDMRHRLSTYITKNPPIDDSATPQKMKKVAQAEQEKADKQDDSGFDGWSDDVISSKKDDDWSEDTSEAAVLKRQEELGDGIKGLTFNTDLEKSEEDRFNIFFTFVKNKINCGGINDVSVFKEITTESERLDIKDNAVLALAELLLNDSILEQIPKYRRLFLPFLANNPKAQKQFIGAFELIVSTHSKVLMPKVAHILKSFYDNDYLEEESILEWSKKISKKYVAKEVSAKIHEKAKPFVEWLENADEESDDEEEDVEVVYTHRSEAVILKEAEKEEVKDDDGGDDDDEDVDIDDI